MYKFVLWIFIIQFRNDCDYLIFFKGIVFRYLYGYLCSLEMIMIIKFLCIVFRCVEIMGIIV